MEYVISDFNGNTSTLAFTISGERSSPRYIMIRLNMLAIANWETTF